MSYPVETYLQKASGESLENVSIEDVVTAINEIRNGDDEHGAFWVGAIIDGENILEANKDLTIIGVFNDEPEVQIKRKAKSWSEIEILYELLLKGRFGELKQALKSTL